jgi:hypothetical protein
VNAENGQKFELRISVELQALDPRGGYATSGNLRVEDRVTVKVNGFLEACKVLARFHELSEQFKMLEKLDEKAR